MAPPPRAVSDVCECGVVALLAALQAQALEPSESKYSANLCQGALSSVRHSEIYFFNGKGEFVTGP